jgi:hypothetical protein
MSTYVKVDGNPDDVTATGARLKAQAAALGAQAQALLQEIKTLDGGEPWGHDEPGREFAKQYNQVPAGGTTPFSESLKDELAKAGELLSKVGDAIMLAMVNYQGTDSANSNDISKV